MNKPYFVERMALMDKDLQRQRKWKEYVDSDYKPRSDSEMYPYITGLAEIEDMFEYDEFDRLIDGSSSLLDGELC